MLPQNNNKRIALVEHRPLPGQKVKEFKMPLKIGHSDSYISKIQLLLKHKEINR